MPDMKLVYTQSIIVYTLSIDTNTSGEEIAMECRVGYKNVF